MGSSNTAKCKFCCSTFSEHSFSFPSGKYHLHRWNKDHQFNTSNYRCVLACPCTHYCTFTCSIFLYYLILKGSSDSHAHATLFQILIRLNFGRKWLLCFNSCVTDGRMDWPTDRPTDRLMDGQTDGRTDTPSYWDARRHLKTEALLA